MPEWACYCPFCSEAISAASPPSTQPAEAQEIGEDVAGIRMTFVDFQIRAWQIDASHAQVLVHSSPVGTNIVEALSDDTQGVINLRSIGATSLPTARLALQAFAHQPDQALAV